MVLTQWYPGSLLSVYIELPASPTLQSADIHVDNLHALRSRNMSMSITIMHLTNAHIGQYNSFTHVFLICTEHKQDVFHVYIHAYIHRVIMKFCTSIHTGRQGHTYYMYWEQAFIVVEYSPSCMHACVCVCVCVRACMCVCVCACVCFTLLRSTHMAYPMIGIILAHSAIPSTGQKLQPRTSAYRWY